MAPSTRIVTCSSKFCGTRPAGRKIDDERMRAPRVDSQGHSVVLSSHSRNSQIRRMRSFAHGMRYGGAALVTGEERALRLDG